MKSVTIDMNCIIDLEENRPVAVHVHELVRRHASGEIGLRVPGIAASERKPGGIFAVNLQEFVEKITKVGLAGAEILKPMGYLDQLRAGRRVYGLRVRLDICPPLRLTRLRYERGCVGVVVPRCAPRRSPQSGGAEPSQARRRHLSYFCRRSERENTIRLAIRFLAFLCFFTLVFELSWPATAQEASCADISRQLGWKEIPAKVVLQTNSPLKIAQFTGFWESEPTLNEPQANWLVSITAKDVSKKPVIAYEIAITLWNPFNEQIGGFLGVSDPGARLVPDAVKNGEYKQVNVNQSSGSLVKGWIQRVKFSDATVWVTR